MGPAFREKTVTPARTAPDAYAQKGGSMNLRTGGDAADLDNQNTSVETIQEPASSCSAAIAPGRSGPRCGLVRVLIENPDGRAAKLWVRCDVFARGVPRD